MVILIPFVGAAIGYFTNLLAITMLFRPHRQIKLGNFVLPFTPGLIPKEKRQLSKKIGEVLGETVLTHEALVKAVVNDEAIDGLTRTMTGFVEKFLDDNRNISQMISQTFTISEEEIFGRTSLKAEDIFDRLLHIATQDFLQNAGRGKTLGDVLPAGLVAHMAEYLRGRISDASTIYQSIIDHPKWGQFLRQTVTKLIKDNTKGLLALLANPDKIYESITKNLTDYLGSEDGQEALNDKLDALLEWVLALEIDDLPQSARDWAAGALENLAQHLKAEGLPQKAAAALLELRPKQIIPARMHQKAAVFVRPLIVFLVDKAGEFVVGAIDIPRIVEGKINEMDVAEVEKIILSVAGKQLRWIAALGGILGFIIGLIPMFIGL